MLTLPFPTIDPTIVSLGPLAVRWYGVSYVVGLLLGWLWVRKFSKKESDLLPGLTYERIDDLLFYSLFGIVLGGRLGYVLFYKPDEYFMDPLRILFVWEGGMSFHGGLLGQITAAYLYCRRFKFSFLRISDILACTAPIGLFFGRIANFINGELYGRPTDVPWSVIFPYGGDLPRHPSQLYEAFLEGVCLFCILNVLRLVPSFKNASGRLAGVFLVGYALARISVEFFREPDAYIGYLWGGITMGQLLTLPLLGIGMYLIVRSASDKALRRA